MAKALFLNGKRTNEEEFGFYVLARAKATPGVFARLEDADKDFRTMLLNLGDMEPWAVWLYGYYSALWGVEIREVSDAEVSS